MRALQGGERTDERQNETPIGLFQVSCLRRSTLPFSPVFGPTARPDWQSPLVGARIVLADRQDGDRLVRKAEDGRRPEAIREIPV